MVVVNYLKKIRTRCVKLVSFHRWCKKSSHSRAQVLYYIAENMELRQQELAQRICAMTGQSGDEAEKEVKAAIQRVFHWAAYTDKYGGTVQVRIDAFNSLFAHDVITCTWAPSWLTLRSLF